MKIVPKTKVHFPVARVIVSFMHGDADANTSDEYDFESFQSAGVFVGDLVILRELDRHDLHSSVQEVSKKYGLTIDKVFEMYCDLVPADCTNDDYRANISSIEIFGMTADGWYEFEIVEE